MTRLFLDTNIVIDFLAERKGFYENAAKVISLPDNGEDVVLLCSSLTYANVNYILSRLTNKETAKKMLADFFKRCKITDIGCREVESALNSSFKDFEDALQYYSALNSFSDAIITRNKKDFILSEIPVYEPTEIFS